MRILALDLGEKNVGVAVSDELELTSNPRGSIRGDATLQDRVLQLIEAEEAGEVIIGLPLLMSGEEGTQAQRAREFAASLAERTAVPVRTWDERLTTRQAERALIAADVRRARRRRQIDQQAAALILDGYLRYRSLRRGGGEESA